MAAVDKLEQALGALQQTSEEALSGPKKAAIVMLALGREHASGIWEMLDDEEIKAISHAMATLGNVTPNQVEDLLVEFVTQMSTTGAILGNFESTERILTEFLWATASIVRTSSASRSERSA